jgi:crotonobetainyl-CoA hydratase
MSVDSVYAEKRGSVLQVTLDRPKANAIDVATSRALGDVFAGFRDDPDLRIAIITGAGEKFFCPGWDLKAAADGEAVDSDYGVGGFGGLQELPDLNKPVNAAEAHRWGLVNEVLPSGSLLERAHELAAALAEGPPLVYAAIKEVSRAAENMRFQDALDGITSKKFPTVDKLYSSEDQLEGARAFAEKRKPQWQGR